MKTARLDIFFRTFNRRPGAGKVYQYQVPAPAATDLRSLLEAAHSAGVPLGGAGRFYGGIFEIQTDDGIWFTEDDGKLTSKHSTFKTWAQLDAEPA